MWHCATLDHMVPDDYPQHGDVRKGASASIIDHAVL